jgi:hypothetical protein
MAKAKEEDYKFLERYRLDDHDSLKDIIARTGTRIHYADFALKVCAIAPDIWVEQQINFPDDLGFYIADVGGVRRYLSSFPKTWLREFSYVLVDSDDLPVEEVRGWRQVLWRLLGAGVLSWAAVKKTFGEPTASPEARERWLKMTFPFRCEDMQRRIPRSN